jgi:type IV pilus assembly protein PilM
VFTHYSLLTTHYLLLTKYMGILSNKSSDANYIGIDIGGSSIKAVELANNNGRAQLVTYGYLERSLSEDKTKLIDQPEKTAEMIKKVIEKSKIISKRVITALPAQAVYTSIISLPEIEKKDLGSAKKIAEAVEWEAKKVLPLPIEEMILDWKILEDEEKLKETIKDEENKKVVDLQVLLTAASKEVVGKYIEIFKKAGLELLSLETESFAMARSLVGKDKSLILIADIGAGATDICVVENAIPLMTRSVNIGGLEITKEIKDTLKVNLSQAEQFKRDLESNSTNLSGQEDLPEVIKKPLQAIINEIQYSINFYLEQPSNKGKKFEKIILSGGTANLFNLTKIITNELKVRTFVGNPWARVIYPQDLQPTLDVAGTRLASAIGLAMRNIE